MQGTCTPRVISHELVSWLEYWPSTFHIKNGNIVLCLNFFLLMLHGKRMGTWMCMVCPLLADYYCVG